MPALRRFLFLQSSLKLCFIFPFTPFASLKSCLGNPSCTPVWPSRFFPSEPYQPMPFEILSLAPSSRFLHLSHSCYTCALMTSNLALQKLGSWSCFRESKLKGNSSLCVALNVFTCALLCWPKRHEPKSQQGLLGLCDVLYISALFMSLKYSVWSLFDPMRINVKSILTYFWTRNKYQVDEGSR